MNNDTNINNYKNNDIDIENQFCVIDEVDNIIQNNQIELMYMDNNNSSKINIFRKSKSYPDKITYNLLTNEFDSCKKKRSIVSIHVNNNSSNYNNINSITTSNLVSDCNLIKNKSIVGICICKFKKI